MGPLSPFSHVRSSHRVLGRKDRRNKGFFLPSLRLGKRKPFQKLLGSLPAIGPWSYGGHSATPSGEWGLKCESRFSSFSARRQARQKHCGDSGRCTSSLHVFLFYINLFSLCFPLNLSNILEALSLFLRRCNLNCFGSFRRKNGIDVLIGLQLTPLRLANLDSFKVRRFAHEQHHNPGPIHGWTSGSLRKY